MTTAEFPEMPSGAPTAFVASLSMLAEMCVNTHETLL